MRLLLAILLAFSGFANAQGHPARLVVVTEGGLAGAEATHWWGIVAPAGTPAAVLKRLEAEMAALLDSAETQKRFQNEGAEVVRMAPPQFGVHLAAETAKWTRVAKQANIKAE